MADVAVLIPVLARPHRVEPLIRSLYASQATVTLRAVFLCSPDDEDELDAVKGSGEDYIVMAEPAGPADYSKKMNTGAVNTDEDFIFLGADDLCFCPEWADRAVDKHRETGKRVIGTNDLGNRTVIRGLHSTHTLFERSYIDLGCWDAPTLLCEVYSHNFVDNEAIATAQQRGEWAFAKDSLVEHLHPFWHKGVMDETYRRGQEGYQADSRLWLSRRERFMGNG